MKKILIVAGISLLTTGIAFYFAKQYELIKLWSLKIDSVSISKYSSQSTTLSLSIKVVNPSAIEAQISKLNGSVTVNGLFIGNVYQTGIMSIPANGYNIISLNVALDNSNTINQILDISSQGSDGAINIHIIGTLLIKSGFIGVTIPIDDNESYTLGQLLSN